MRVNVGVLFGGKSVEHEVSIISALQAINHFPKEKYNIIPIYITEESRFFTGKSLEKMETFKERSKVEREALPVEFVKKGNSVLLKGRGALPWKRYSRRVDLLFPIAHGSNVEDGTLQGVLEMVGLPYVGCDVTASVITMDKVLTKSVLKECGIPVLECVSFRMADYYRDQEKRLNEIEEKNRYPMIVKPVNLGSSIGVSKCSNREELINSIEEAAQFSDYLLVEKCVEDLLEINCSVLGDHEEAQCSVCEEPLGNDEILSFGDKYLSSGSTKGMASIKRRIPADIPKEISQKIEEYALKAFKITNCSGVSRIDFMVERGTSTVFINEINTIPGSLSFYLWKESGLSYPELLEKLIQIAYKRHRLRERHTYSYKTNILAQVPANGAAKGKS